MRLLFPDAGWGGLGCADITERQDNMVWWMSRTCTYAQSQARKAMVTTIGRKQDGHDKHGMGFRQMPFLG